MTTFMPSQQHIVFTDPFLASYASNPRRVSASALTDYAIQQDLAKAFAKYSMCPPSSSNAYTALQPPTPNEDDDKAGHPLLRLQQSYNERSEFPFPSVDQIAPCSVNQKLNEVLEKDATVSYAHKISLTIQTPAKPYTTSFAHSPDTPPLTPPGLSSPAESYRDLPTPIDGKSFFASPTSLLTPEPENDLLSPEEEEQVEQPTVSQQLLSQRVLLPAFASQYTILSELGTGGFGFVVRGYRNRDSRDVAIKFIYKQSMPAHAWVRDITWSRGTRSMPSEAQMLMRIKHDGVVAFLDLFEDEDYFYMVMEHHGSPWANQKEPVKVVRKSSPGQVNLVPPTPTRLEAPKPPPVIRRSSCDLFECIEQRSKLSENEARYVFAQVVSIMHFLHQRGVYHMDLKDENIVIDQKLKVKLIDFGSAVRCQPNKIFHKFYGTVAYAAPEILQQQSYLAPSSEIWALGILFSILLSGESIYRDADAALRNEYNVATFANLSPDCQHILHLCLQFDPSQRATISELRYHPWLKPTIDQIERRS